MTFDIKIDLGMGIPKWASHLGWITTRTGQVKARLAPLKASGTQWEAEDGSLWDINSEEGDLVLRSVQEIPFLYRTTKTVLGPGCYNPSAVARLKLLDRE